MQASELIELCKRHPKAMERIGLAVDDDRIDTARWNECFPRVHRGAVDPDGLIVATRFIGYALIEWCDAHDIEAHVSVRQKGVQHFGWSDAAGTSDDMYPSRLECLLSAVSSAEPAGEGNV